MGKFESAEDCVRAKGVMKCSTRAGMAELMLSWKGRNGEVEGQAIKRLMQDQNSTKYPSKDKGPKPNSEKGKKIQGRGPRSVMCGHMLPVSCQPLTVSEDTCEGLDPSC